MCYSFCTNRAHTNRYSLPITTAFKTTTTHAFDSKDLDVQPESEWRVALDLQGGDEASLASSLHFVQDHSLRAGEAPFNHTGWPVYIEAPVREVSSKVRVITYFSLYFSLYFSQCSV